jgi:hypothetical protein
VGDARGIDEQIVADARRGHAALHRAVVDVGLRPAARAVGRDGVQRIELVVEAEQGAVRHPCERARLGRAVARERHGGPRAVDSTRDFHRAAERVAIAEQDVRIARVVHRQPRHAHALVGAAHVLVQPAGACRLLGVVELIDQVHRVAHPREARLAGPVEHEAHLLDPLVHRDRLDRPRGIEQQALPHSDRARLRGLVGRAIGGRRRAVVGPGTGRIGSAPAGIFGRRTAARGAREHDDERNSASHPADRTRSARHSYGTSSAAPGRSVVIE